MRATNWGTVSVILCSLLFLLKAHTIAHTNTVFPTFLSTTPFLCHVDFLLGLTLKSGHHIYTTACTVASMTKPLHRQQRRACVESEQ